MYNCVLNGQKYKIQINCIRKFLLVEPLLGTNLNLVL